LSLLRPPGVSETALAAALRESERVAARDQSNLYRTSQFFEDPARYEAFVAMYAVMRLVDDYVDGVEDKPALPREERQGMHCALDGWERRIRAAYEGRPEDRAIDLALSAAVTTFPVPLARWLRFLDAMRFDVDHARFDTFDRFVEYSEGATVSPTVVYVYLLTAVRAADGVYRVSGFDYETCGRELGHFAYLAHVLRDVVPDLSLGREGLVYLSGEDLRGHGLSEADLRSFAKEGAADDRWGALVRSLCARAHERERRGVALAQAHYPEMAPDCAFILGLIIAVYQLLLTRIEAEPAWVFSRARPSP
jgi:phytoene/squalene synthetase